MMNGLLRAGLSPPIQPAGVEGANLRGDVLGILILDLDIAGGRIDLGIDSQWLINH